MIRLKRFWGVWGAAVSMYTRLPLWKMMKLEEYHYQNAVSALPLVGFLTGGGMALVYLGSYYLLTLPHLTSVLLAISSRLLLTGAFHEDGLGDFFDGFGGGRDKESILRIMKDSRVGSYAVIGFVIYFALFVSLIDAIPTERVALLLLVADVLGKQSVVFLVQILPYARDRESSKIGVVYHFPIKTFSIISLVLVVPLIVCLQEINWKMFLLPVLFFYLFLSYVERKLSGYTGDICGALMLLVELMVWLSYLIFCV